MNYSINDLQVFLWVAEELNLSACARRAQLTPAAVSAIIKRLESSLGVRLLERSSRVCRLTTAGESFRLAAAQSVAGLRAAEQAVRTGVRELSGLVRLAAPSDLAREVLSAWLDEFQTDHPKIELAVYCSDNVQDLLRDSIDLAVRYGNLPDSRLIARRLCETRRITCAAPSYLARCGIPQAPQDLVTHNCLTFRVGGRIDTHWQFQTQEGNVSVRVSGNRHSDDSALVKQWAIQGLGILNKSDIDVESALQEGKLVQLLAEFPGPIIPLSLVFAGPRTQPAAVRALADFLVERFAMRAT